jgi:hypothetical protein
MLKILLIIMVHFPNYLDDVLLLVAYYDSISLGIYIMLELMI